MASLLVGDVMYEGGEVQITALREGLGLDTPGDFWSVIGEKTGGMAPEDKIILLTHLVPRFGKVSEQASELTKTHKHGLYQIQRHGHHLSQS